MPKKKQPDFSDLQLEALNRRMEDAIAVHLADGVRRMRTDLTEGKTQKVLHDAIRSGDFSKLDGHIPYDGFNSHVDRAGSKLASMAPRTRDAVRAGIRGGISGPGAGNRLLTTPLNFDAPLPGKTAPMANARSELHRQARRGVKRDALVEAAVQDRTRKYMKQVVGVQRRNLETAVAQGVKHQLSLPEVVAQVRSQIGLTQKQGASVTAVYDNAIDKGLGKARAQELADAQSEKMLDYRAETIAVTETRTLSETIKQSEWLTAEGDGQLGDNPQVTWILGALDDKTCAICIDVANTSMPLGSMFTLSNGIECLPGFAHPRCRCYSMLTTDDDAEGGGKEDVDSRGEDLDADEDVDAMAGRA